MNSRDEATRDAWRNALIQNRLLYPDERVVSFLSRRFPETSQNVNRNAIDIGFGSGRHMKLMLDFGFRTWGIEYTEESVSIAKAMFSKAPLIREIVLADYRTFQFQVAFDVVLAWGVVFLDPPSEMLHNLSRIATMLADGGRAFLNFRTKENWFFGLGREIETGCYILDERAGTYSGICYTFMDLHEVEQLIDRAGLTIVHVEKTTFSKNDMRELNSWLQVELLKK